MLAAAFNPPTGIRNGECQDCRWLQALEGVELMFNAKLQLSSRLKARVAAHLEVCPLAGVQRV